MKKLLMSAILAFSLPMIAMASDILKFDTMYGVDGPFVGGTEIRNVLGDELPWAIKSAKGSLSTNGTLKISVKGLVFSNDPSVPPEKRGTNDEAEFRGLVSCITEGDDGKITFVKIMTKGFPATTTGNSEIEEQIQLPESCVAPIIFIMAGSEEKWFAVTGAELEPKK
ncbi:MAG: hypothetical protein ACXVLQ_14125 [Bacteriovorax sp.]